MTSDVVADGSRIGPPNRPAGKPGRSGPPGNSNARIHGSSRAAADLKELVRRSMDGRTSEAREVAEWCADYAGDLGGLDELTTAQRTLLQHAGHTVLQLRRVDAFIASMETIAHRKRRQLYPIIVQRAALVNTLRGLLSDLGLERRAKQVPDLDAYLRDRAATAAAPAEAAPPAEAAVVDAEVSADTTGDDPA
ncbi:hypothetical protein KF840_21680 [bacterium]|nr:hypothetical protein [bacterium]